VNKNQILIGLSESEKTKFGREDFADQSLPQKVFTAIWAIESEVNNGGFSQFFLSGNADSASFVVEAMEMIGAPKTASICKRAIDDAFPAGLPQTLGINDSELVEFSGETLEKLGTLDQEFVEYPHNLTDLLFAYVLQHPEEFGTLPNLDDT
jgi:hypothetical protein